MAEQKPKRSKRPDIQYYKPKGQTQQISSQSAASKISNLSTSNPPKSGGHHSRRRRGCSNISGTESGTANDQGDDSTVGTLSFPITESNQNSVVDTEIAARSYQPHDSGATTEATHSFNEPFLSSSQQKSLNPKSTRESHRPVFSTESESSRNPQKQPPSSPPVLTISKPNPMPSQDVRCTASSNSNNGSQISSESGSGGARFHQGGLIQLPRELVASINQAMQLEQGTSSPEYTTGRPSPHGAMRPKSSEKPTLAVRPTLSARENPVSAELCGYWNVPTTSESRPLPPVARNLDPLQADDTIIAYTSPPAEELVDPLQAMNISNWVDLLEDSETSSPTTAPSVSARNAQTAAPTSPVSSSSALPASPQSPRAPNTPSYAAAARLTSMPQQTAARSPPSRTGGSASSMVPIGHLRHSDSVRSPRPDDSGGDTHTSSSAQAALEGPAAPVPSSGLRATLEPSAGGPMSRRSDTTTPLDSYSNSRAPQSPNTNVLREVATRLLGESICVL